MAGLVRPSANMLNRKRKGAGFSHLFFSAYKMDGKMLIALAKTRTTKTGNKQALSFPLPSFRFRQSEKRQQLSSSSKLPGCFVDVL
jgi:hypothetical protein